MGSNDTLCNDKAQPKRYQTCPKEPVYFLLLGPAVAPITYWVKGLRIKKAEKKKNLFYFDFLSGSPRLQSVRARWQFFQHVFSRN